MKLPIPDALEDRMRLAALLIVMGLTIEFVSVFWVHPFSFMFFAGPGLAATAAGTLLYFYSAVAAQR